MEKEKKYTIEVYLKAAELGEVSMIDARHVCSLLDEARKELKRNTICKDCKSLHTNPFEADFCKKYFDIENGNFCEGTEYESRNNTGVSVRFAV
jgi:hypothetical protein